ncbi:unnamed protein product [Ectocarpus sp. 13 AM-2016]
MLHVLGKTRTNRRTQEYGRCSSSLRPLLSVSKRPGSFRISPRRNAIWEGRSTERSWSSAVRTTSYSTPPNRRAGRFSMLWNTRKSSQPFTGSQKTAWRRLFWSVWRDCSIRRREPCRRDEVSCLGPHAHQPRRLQRSPERGGDYRMRRRTILLKPYLSYASALSRTSNKDDATHTFSKWASEDDEFEQSFNDFPRRLRPPIPWRAGLQHVEPPHLGKKIVNLLRHSDLPWESGKLDILWVDPVTGENDLVPFSLKTLEEVYYNEELGGGAYSRSEQAATLQRFGNIRPEQSNWNSHSKMKMGLAAKRGAGLQ